MKLIMASGADETCCMSNGQTQPILTYSVNFSCCFEQKHEQLNPITKTSGAQECRQRKKLKTWYGGDIHSASFFSASRANYYYYATAYFLLQTLYITLSYSVGHFDGPACVSLSNW